MGSLLPKLAPRAERKFWTTDWSFPWLGLARPDKYWRINSFLSLANPWVSVLVFNNPEKCTGASPWEVLQWCGHVLRWDTRPARGDGTRTPPPPRSGSPTSYRRSVLWTGPAPPPAWGRGFSLGRSRAGHVSWCCQTEPSCNKVWQN